jgi:TatD DNase family protein
MRLYGVGEIGLDLYWSQEFFREKREALHAQLELALQYDMPVVIHTRSAYEQMLDAVATYRGRGLRGVFHAFADSADMARKLCREGDFFIGVGGVVTFKNAKKLKEVAAGIPIENIVLETDSPYLAPVPYRGKRNSSLYLPYIAEAIAQIKGMDTEEVIARTEENAERLYRLR